MQYHLHKAKGDGHCLVHCFAKRFNEANELELEKLWDEMNENFELYIRFGVYESPEDSRIELAKYTFSKNYSNDTADLAIKLECSSMWIKYSNIHKITLEWISQTSSILSKLDSITTCSAQIRICSFEVAWTIFLYFVYWSPAGSFNKNFTFRIRPAFNFENPSAQEIFRTVLIDAAKYEGTRPLKSVRENKVYTIRNHALKSITCDAFLNLSERGSQLIFELFLNSLNVS